MKSKLLGVLIAAGAVSWGSIALAGSHDEAGYEGEAYELDTAHTVVGFSVRHLGIVNVRGKFDEYTGKVLMSGDDVSTLSIHATIKAASIDTANSDRDNHLRSADFFEVETYPEIKFHSKEVVSHGDGLALVGDLTIKDVTKEVKLPLTVSEPVEDPWGNTRIGIALGGSISRRDFGVANDGAGDRTISDAVTFDIQLQGIKK